MGTLALHPKEIMSLRTLTFSFVLLVATIARANAGCPGDLGEIEVGLGLAAIDVKNAATACNSNGTTLTECTDDVDKINGQLTKVNTHVTSANSDCNATAGSDCAGFLTNLTSAMGKATADFTHAATTCANA